MQAKFFVKDGISEDLAQKAAALRDAKPVLEAAGLQLVSLTKRSFRDESLRPAPWPPRKKPAAHSLLRKSGALWQSIRIISVGNDRVTVGSDRPYAAVHQFGSKKKKKNIPPRPFFPFTSDGRMTSKAADSILGVIRAKIDSLLK